MARQLDYKEYKRAFLDNSKKGKALEYALETRKFEIELYWKRASYFWTFIAAALAAYGVIRASKDIAQKEHLSVLVGVLGFVFSFAWQAVNRGSKHWQENWENHVAILEDEVIGPLYKTVSKRPRATGLNDRISNVLTGPREYSVSKINQIVSLFVTVVWGLLILDALPPFDMKARLDWPLIIVISLGTLTCLAMYKYGWSHSHDHEFIVTQHTSQIIKDENTVSTPSVPSD
ncbi:MAG: hypothetical protein QOC96_2129 [Acidobacteriota bacterium]|jgi:hypothetical protein|nr:hypothetical protein [Acidobacteriota bacterium]